MRSALWREPCDAPLTPSHDHKSGVSQRYKRVAKQLTEKELRQQAVRALTDSLGPVEALRFLALVSREPFDYQEWRREYFSEYDLDKLLIEIRKAQ